MSKLILVILLISLIISEVVIFSAHLALAQPPDTAHNPIFGTIKINTAWTKANSPYNLREPVTVSNGTTLTIEAGVTVNLYNFYIQVDGTLKAQGSKTDNIIFNSASPHIYPFYPYSTYPKWNIYLTAVSSNCIIENAFLNSTIITDENSARINNDTIYNAYWTVGNATVVSDCIFNYASITTEGSSLIYNNTFLDGGDYYWMPIQVQSGSPTIIDNIIASAPGNILGIGIMLSGGPTQTIIAGNTISNCKDAAIQVTDTITDPSSILIEGNLIWNNSELDFRGEPVGLGIGIQVIATKTTTTQNLVIRNNTITGNSMGINILKPMLDNITPNLHPTIIYNNIFNNNQSNLVLGQTLNYGVLKANDINASYNWWGTTDIQAVNQTIYDSKNDSEQGTVTFTPLLNAPNPQAAPNSYVAIAVPSPTPYQSPAPIQSHSPSVPEFPTFMMTVLAMIAVFAAILLYRGKLKK